MMKPIQVEISELPQTVNRLWRHTARGGYVSVYKSKEGKEFQERLRGIFLKMSDGPQDGAFIVDIILFMPDKRARDIDNFSKGILDALNTVVWHDDDQVVELIIKKRYRKNEPGTFIKIRKI